MPRNVSGYGVTIVTKDKRVCDILLRLGRIYGGTGSDGVRRLPVEEYHPLPQVVNTITGITCINESHPPLGETRQFITLIVDDPATTATAYREAFDEAGVASEAGDFQKLHPYFPPGLLAFVKVEDIRVTFFPADEEKIGKLAPPLEPYLDG